MAKKWEYKVVQPKQGNIDFDELQALGEDGWEMCGVSSFTLPVTDSLVTTYYFKRSRKAGLHKGNEGYLGDNIA